MFRVRVITGKAKGRTLKTVKGREVRPTSDRVKETLFNVLAPRVVGARFLDMFAGSGAVGIEALSRGAASCTFVELQTAHFRVIEENLRSTGLLAGSDLIRRDARAALTDLGKRGRQYDLIFIDPPYNAGLIPPVLDGIAEHGLLSAGGWAVCEHHRKDPVPVTTKHPPEAGGLTKFRELVLGETVLSLYWLEPQEGTTVGEGDLSRKL